MIEQELYISNLTEYTQRNDIKNFEEATMLAFFKFGKY